jgi:GT2 family glycosyltransferase
MSNFVVAVVATFRRPAELSRLIESLAQIRNGLGAAVVVDNGSDPAVRTIVESAACTAAMRCVDPGENLGCGGGLRLAEKTALDVFGSHATHIWILDDDAVVSPDALDALTGEMKRAGADAACPMVLDERGRVAWFPGLLDAQKFRVIRGAPMPEEFARTCGDAPIPFSWCTGISLLVSRRAIDEIGFHRDDFWVRGEDLEFSLRVTARFKGIYVPKANVRHLPPKSDGATALDEEYLKHCAMLQNLCYTAIRLKHGRRIARTLPGNFRRFLKTWRARSLPDAFRAFWLGAVLGRSAGAVGWDVFRQRLPE